MATSTLQTAMQTRLGAYINRTVAELTVSGLAMALDAMNMAKLDAQRRHNFKMCRSSGYIATTVLGNSMVNATSDFAGTVPMSFKYIEAMWTVATNASVQYRGNRVPAMTIGDQKLLHGTSTQWNSTTPAALPPNSLQNQSMSQRWFQNGLLVCVNDVFTTAQVFWIDGITWLPAYDGTTTTDDFFLVYDYDWLFLAALDYMNLFLKEDQRIPISSTKMEKLFNSVVAYDEQFSEGAFDIDEGN